jgi:hypothetical protein
MWILVYSTELQAFHLTRQLRSSSHHWHNVAHQNPKPWAYAQKDQGGLEPKAKQGVYFQLYTLTLSGANMLCTRVIRSKQILIGLSSRSRWGIPRGNVQGEYKSFLIRKVLWEFGVAGLNSSQLNEFRVDWVSGVLFLCSRWTDKTLVIK